MKFFYDVDGIRGFTNSTSRWFFNDVPEESPIKALNALREMLAAKEFRVDEVW